MVQTQAAPVQQSQVFDLPSGAKLAVTVAPFVDAWALMKATLKTLKGVQLNADAIGADVIGFLSTPAGISTLIDRVAEFATSPEVEAAMWQCAARALYIPVGSSIEFPGTKVNRTMFDDQNFGMQAREDYSSIVIALMKVNCAPFLAQALSGLKRQKGGSTSVPPSK